MKSANANRKQQRGRSKIATRNSQIWWPDWARTSDPYQYHARVRIGGRLYRRAVGTNDYQVARRKLSDFKRELGRTDARVSKTSFGAVRDKYAQTIGGLSASSQKDNRATIGKLKSTWLSRHCGDKGASYYNSVLTVVRNALELAVRDRIIADSPAAHLNAHKIGQTQLYLVRTDSNRADSQEPKSTSTCPRNLTTLERAPRIHNAVSAVT